MESPLARTVHERLTVRHVLPMVAFLVLVYGFTRSVETTVVIAVGFTLVETIQILWETPSIDDRWVGIGNGVFITVVSLAWLAYELTVASNIGGPAWFPGLTALIGVWFLFDARKDFAEGRDSYSDEEMDTSEMMLVMNHGHLVVEELKTGPKTIAELADAYNLTESRIREALNVATGDEMVYRVDSDSPKDTERYALDESKVGGVAFVRSNGKRIVQQLVRPFRR